MTLTLNETFRPDFVYFVYFVESRGEWGGDVDETFKFRLFAILNRAWGGGGELIQ